MIIEKKFYQHKEIAQSKSNTVVWEIFVRDNLVVCSLCCVIFSWVSCTHENILPSNFVTLYSNLHPRVIALVKGRVAIWYQADSKNKQLTNILTSEPSQTI